MKKKRKSETPIQTAILEYLSYQPGFYFRINTMGVPIAGKPGKFRPAQTTGIPDIHGHYSDGTAVYIEVKRPENKDRPEEQVAFIERSKKNKCIAFFATSVDDVMKVFEELKNEEKE